MANRVMCMRKINGILCYDGARNPIMGPVLVANIACRMTQSYYDSGAQFVNLAQGAVSHALDPGFKTGKCYT